MKGKKCNKSKYMVLKSESWACFFYHPRGPFFWNLEMVYLTPPGSRGRGRGIYRSWQNELKPSPPPHTLLGLVKKSPARGRQAQKASVEKAIQTLVLAYKYFTVYTCLISSSARWRASSCSSRISSKYFFWSSNCWWLASSSFFRSTSSALRTSEALCCWERRNSSSRLLKKSNSLQKHIS